MISSAGAESILIDIYLFIKICVSSEVLKKCSIKNIIGSLNIIKIMKLMIPFTPHLANECLELMNCKIKNDWPKILQNTLEELQLAVQINGKTRDIININKDMIEEEIKEIVLNKSKAKKYIENKKIVKIIFVKNKIINYIISN